MDGKIKGRFGFGMMRLPKIGDEIDIEQTKKMCFLPPQKENVSA